MSGFGGVAAPLLAGFSLASIVTLMTTDSKPEYTEWSVMAFTIATGSFLFAIQFTFVALGYWLLPSDHLQWTPEARRSYRELEGVILRQRTAGREFARYARVAWYLFHFGVVALLSGVAAVLVPEKGQWTVLRGIALVVVVVCLITQLAWASDRFVGGRLSMWAMRAMPKRVHAPANIDPALVALVADDGFAAAMKEGARHRNKCSWTTLNEVTISEEGLTHFREQQVRPTMEVWRRRRWRRRRYFAMTGSGNDIVVVLPDRVLYGCKEHVKERLDRFCKPRDAREIAKIREAIQQA